MPLIDLTLPISPVDKGVAIVQLEEWPLDSEQGPHTGMIYRFDHNGMVGTYIDFPGHIKETDDGIDAAAYPPEKLYRIPATVIHMNREGDSGAVTGDELEQCCPQPFRGEALVLNALGAKRYDAIRERSVWLARDAREWIADRGAHLLVSDIYERDQPEGVFMDLFRRRVSTVCRPVNLHQLRSPYVRLTALCARFEGVTQLPCRILAETD